MNIAAHLRSSPTSITVISVVVSIIVWVYFFHNVATQNEPALTGLQPNLPANTTQAQNYEMQKNLAEAYWLRYDDVRNHHYFGENGVLGITGAQEHFRQYGKKEKRIFARLVIPADLEAEKRYAEFYWARYPDIAASTVWGVHSKLGILGPRDHYIHIGRHEGKIWGNGQEVK